jgi:hypothetical protein
VFTELGIEITAPQVPLLWGMAMTQLHTMLYNKSTSNEQHVDLVWNTHKWLCGLATCGEGVESRPQPGLAMHVVYHLKGAAPTFTCGLFVWRLEA